MPMRSGACWNCSESSVCVSYFILIFNVGLREAGKVEEEELLGTLEDSMSCHLNLPWGEHSVFHSASYTDTHRPSQR